jgi:hypothetical protein
LRHFRRDPAGIPPRTPEKIKAVNILLCDKLFDGPPKLRQANARLLLSEVAVTSSEIEITGPKSVPARFASTELGDTAPSVLPFVHEWRTIRDSNPARLSGDDRTNWLLLIGRHVEANESSMATQEF